MTDFAAECLAAQTVREVIFNGRNLRRAFESIDGMDSRAKRLAFNTLRFHNRLDAMASLILYKELPHDEIIRALLAVAVGQLLESPERAGAVVNRAVDAAGFLNPPLRKLANATLRTFLRSKDEIIAEIDSQTHLQFAHPKWWTNKIRAQHPQNWQEQLSRANFHPPLTLRINRRRTTAEECIARFQRAEMDAEIIGDDAVILQPPTAANNIPGFLQGWVTVQDFAAQRAAKILAPQNGMRILDACAAPGGKASHLLEIADIKLTAIDSDESRIALVSQTLKRLGLTANLICGDAKNPSSWWNGIAFDLILCDAPCSASGVARRHPDIKWLRRESDIAVFAESQRAMLDSLWPLLKKNGRMLYATCSIFDEENQQAADSFLNSHADAAAVKLESLKDGATPPPLEDGFFYALFKKN